jgi:hypothetical protein
MKLPIYLLGFIFLVSCNTTIKLAIPTVFKEQATEQHVNGARKKVMTLGTYRTSKIKRGWHVSAPGWGRGFFLENLLLNQFNLQKNELVSKEKDNFRYAVSDGDAVAQVYGKESKLTREYQYKLGTGKGFPGNISQLQESRYIFSALISTDTISSNGSWELLMTNIYDRKKDNDKRIFTHLKQEDDGMATNGTDTIYIRPVSLNNTENSSGKQGKLLFKIHGGYELHTSDGVIAIIDLIGSNVWMYNDLEANDRLIISAISTAIFARRVSNPAWK